MKDLNSIDSIEFPYVTSPVKKDHNGGNGDNPVLHELFFNIIITLSRARSTRDGDTGNEDNSSFARFFKLDKYAMFSGLFMTSGLASDSFSLKSS